MESMGTWETQWVPLMEVVVNNVKNGGDSKGPLGVGSTNSRGVAGAMPGDTKSVLEGVDGQSQMEGRAARVRRDGNGLRAKLTIITEMARKSPQMKFRTLMHLVNEESLAECFWDLRRSAAPGIDKVTVRKYERDLQENLRDLMERMRAWHYRPQPSRRVWIPKDNGSLRPLGIPAVEDKLVQMVIARILEAIYEQDFLDESYGFRPNRSCHKALAALDKSIMSRPVNYVVEADIKGFFDHVDHTKLMKCLEQRIADSSILRMIGRILRAGVVEEGRYLDTESGTPQGGVISPILANIYLHYALDTWFHGILRKRLRGYAELNRYADDFVICVQRKEDAELILQAIKERFASCGLSLSEEKTRLVEFGRKAGGAKDGQGVRPGTFDYLGFTHYCDKTRRGGFKVGRKTSRKKYKAKVKEMSEWLRKIRNAKPLCEWWPTLIAKLRGHFAYYGVTGNYRWISRYKWQVEELVYKWLNRRSQRKSMNRKKFYAYLKMHVLPKPRIQHTLSWPWS
jgi:RNA-directed DNA polymerase